MTTLDQPMTHETTALSDPRFWNQIGPFGGWLAATLVDGICEHAGDDWPLLSVQVHFLGAVREGAMRVRVAPVRRQRTLSSWRAELLQDGAIAVTADAILGARRSTEVPPPSLPDGPVPPRGRPDELPRWHGVDALARFVRAFDYRLAWGAPFEGGPGAESAGWIRLDAPTSFGGPARLLLLADAWFPSLWARLDRPVPVTTVSLHVLFNPGALASREAARDFLAAHHRADAVANGWGHERGTLWWPDGSLALQAQQLTWIALDKPHKEWR